MEHMNNEITQHQGIVKVWIQQFNVLNDAWNLGEVSDDQFEEIARILGEVYGLSLPPLPDNVSRETYSPEHRNRPTSESSTIVGDMNNKENNMNIEDAMKALVEHITQQVADSLEARLAETVENAIEEALENYDPTEHYNFADSVKDTLSGIEITLTGAID